MLRSSLIRINDFTNDELLYWSENYYLPRRNRSEALSISPRANVEIHKIFGKLFHGGCLAVFTRLHRERELEELFVLVDGFTLTNASFFQIKKCSKLAKWQLFVETRRGCCSQVWMSPRLANNGGTGRFQIDLYHSWA